MRDGVLYLYFTSFILVHHLLSLILHLLALGFSTSAQLNCL